MSPLEQSHQDDIKSLVTTVENGQVATVAALLLLPHVRAQVNADPSLIRSLPRAELTQAILHRRF